MPAEEARGRGNTVSEQAEEKHTTDLDGVKKIF
jgi:hypothetical protein